MGRKNRRRTVNRPAWATGTETTERVNTDPERLAVRLVVRGLASIAILDNVADVRYATRHLAQREPIR